MAGRFWTDEEKEYVRAARARGDSVSDIARKLNRTLESVKQCLTRLRLSGDVAPRPDAVPSLPEPCPEAGGPGLPEPSDCSYEPFRIDAPGKCGIIGDLHIPYHDTATIRDWVSDCKKMGVSTLLLNGDILDCFMVSSHYREPNKPRMKEELEKGRQFLEYLRSSFPKTRIVYRMGNHDDRLRRYLAERAPEIFDIEDVHLPALLRFEQFGVECVQDKRVVMVGKLPTIHGHEYQGGGGVMPARWLYLRTGESALTSHFHQQTYYTFRTITGKEVGMWSLGCACFLSPAYRPLNQWGHGWCVVEIGQDQSYHVHSRRRLRNGQVV
jgi:predicted phosphodiesterase